MTIVWESLDRLLMLCDTTSSGNEWSAVVRSLSGTLFHKQTMQFMQMVRDYEMKEAVSDSLRHCYGCCMILSELIADVIRSATEREAQDHPEDVMTDIELFTNLFRNVILPYVLGSDDIPSKDFTQYAVEISGDVRSYVRGEGEFWRKMTNEIHVAEKKRVAMAIGLGITCGILGALPGPGWIASPALSIAANVGVRTFWYVEKKRLERIEEEGITLMYPEIWRRDMSNKKPRIMDITGVKSPPSDRMCLVFYEGSASSNSQ